MIKVKLWGALSSHTDGVVGFDIEAKTIRDVYDYLSNNFPGLKPILHEGEGVSVSINGLLYNDALFQEIPEDSEVFILPRIEGG